MSNQITLVTVNNPFDLKDRSIKTVDHTPALTLAGYIRQAPGYDPEVDFAAAVNGALVPVEEWTTTSVLRPGSYITLVPVVGKGGGKNPLALIAGIALSILTVGVGNLVTTGVWSTSTAGIAAWGFAGFAAATATMYLGGALLSHLSPVPKIDIADIEQASPTYSWSRMQSMTGQGNALPLVYGTVRTAGQILAQHVSTDGNNQYLNLLLGAGEGPIDAIGDIYINDNPISAYQGVAVDVRMGTNDQSPIPFFNDTFTDQPLSVELILGEGFITRQTVGNAVQGLEVTIELPGGLYHVKDDGNLDAAHVSIYAQYQRVGESVWYTWTAWLFQEATNEAIRRSYRIDNLPPGQYAVRLYCQGKSGTSSRDSTRVYWTQLSGIVYDDFCRPGRALVGIRALATNQLSGGVPNVTFLVCRSTVNVWNPIAGAWVAKPATNPAWASYDMLNRTRLLRDVRDGVYKYVTHGVKADRINYQEFADWADDCTARNLTVNLYVDRASDLEAALKDLELVGRGKVVRKGTKFGAVSNRPSAPVQLFTVSNIVEGSFEERFLSLRDRANSVEITYNDAAKGYQRGVATAYSDDYNTSDIIKNPTQVAYNAITSFEQAWREAKYLLRLNQYLVRTCTFKADVDAIACQIGDVVLVQHDLPHWGDGGRIVGVERIITDHFTDEITLDKPITMDPAKQYEIMIRLGATDALVKKTVIVPGELTTTNIITVATPFATLPAETDVYTFGQVNLSAKPFRVVNITRDSDQVRRLSCLEYIEAVYNEATDIPDIQYSAPLVISVSGLTATEGGYKQRDGTQVSTLVASWRYQSERGLVLKWEVQLRAAGGSWQRSEFLSQATYTRDGGLQTGNTYAIRIRPVGQIGLPLAAWIESGQVFITGQVDATPPEITDFSAVQNGRYLRVNGKAPAIPDLWKIEIRIDGSNWATARPLTSIYNFPADIDGLFDGTHIVRAKAVDNGGNYSTADATAIITLAGINQTKNIVIDRDDVALGTGTLTGLVRLPDGALITPSSITLGDYPTFGDLPIAEFAAPVTRAEFLSPVIDTFKIGLTGVAMDLACKVAEAEAVFGSFPDRVFGDYPYDTFGSITTASTVQTLIAQSPTNNDNWTPMVGFTPGEYNSRYFQYRVIIDVESQTARVQVDRLRQVYDVPDVEFTDTIEIPPGGMTIDFLADYGADFYEAPTEITLTTIDGAGNVFPDVTDLTAVSATINCYDRTGANVGGTLKAKFKGY